MKVATPIRGASVIVYGPQGSGKTLHAEALRAYFGCDTVEEDDNSNVYRHLITDRQKAEFIARNVLVLTSVPPPKEFAHNRRALHISDALQAAGITPHPAARFV